jgi:YegS/Rv2252/BmrU family lipid kinase
VAAGGDGTINEVLNGICNTREGLACARLGVLPVGTVNVFARQHNLPAQLPLAWKVIRQGRERAIDVLEAQFMAQGQTQRRCFAQMAGAGLDARAVELVSWGAKKRIPYLAYILAGLRAVIESQSQIAVSVGAPLTVGELVLIGNGQFYAGELVFFPQAKTDDGRLDVCVFPRANWFVAACCAVGLLTRRRRPNHSVRYFQTDALQLSSSPPAPLELDGELVGCLPVCITAQPRALRIIVP